MAQNLLESHADTNNCTLPHGAERTQNIATLHTYVWIQCHLADPIAKLLEHLPNTNDKK